VVIDSPETRFVGNVHIDGKLTVEQGSAGAENGPLQVNAGLLVKGGLLLEGGLFNEQGQVYSNQVSLENHRHSQEGSGPPDIGPEKAPMSCGCSDWYKELHLDSETQLIDKDCLLLCLPEIAEAEAQRASSPAEEQGWTYLRAMLYRWFKGEAFDLNAAKERERNAQEAYDLGNMAAQEQDPPFGVDWDWVTSFPKAAQAYAAFTQKPTSVIHLPEGSLDYSDYIAYNIYNRKAQKLLGDFLLRDKLLTSSRREFDYRQLPPEKWESRAFNFYPVSRNLLSADGLQAAMGAFTLRALAKGYSEPRPGGGHTIQIDEVYIFVCDAFAFSEGEFWGFWSCEEKRYIEWYEELRSLNTNPSRLVNGSDFLSFRRRHKRGGDFAVMSPLRQVENFAPMGYAYP
jgi:hypothetical protein